MIRRIAERLAFIGVVAGDSEEGRVQKVTLTVAAVTVTVLSVVWVGTYLLLGLPGPAAIPFAYQVISTVSLAAFARTKDYRFFRFSQLVLIIALPFLLQWSLGGYVVSSAVSLWALIGAFGALFFYGARNGIPWFVAFIVLTEAVFERLRSAYSFEARGDVEIKGKGLLRTYLLVGRRSSDPA